jgi:short-subunit dehydrogenase
MQSYSILESLLFFNPIFLFGKEQLKRTISGKTILITGASFGIGESLAFLLADSGAELILVARTEEKLLELQSKIRQSGAKAEIFAADLTKEEDLDKLISYLSSYPKDIDVFVNNAGKSIRRSIFESLDRYHDFQRTMALNYFAPVKLLLYLIPKLEMTKGQIINVSAVNVLMIPAPKWAAYQASKTAFDQWMRSVAAELKKRRISTSNVYLPLVRTRMIAPTKAYEKMPAMKPEHVAKIIAGLIAKRKGSYQPWWAFWGSLASVLFRKIWERSV